jgi:hypothetical protein
VVAAAGRDLVGAVQGQGAAAGPGYKDATWRSIMKLTVTRSEISLLKTERNKHTTKHSDCCFFCWLPLQDVIWWVLYKAEALLLGSRLRKAALGEVSYH